MTDPGGSWHVVFGATGAIGGAVVGELARAGRQVRAVSRSGQAPDGAQGMAADASDQAQAAPAAAGAFVIYHCASPPDTQWPELFPILTGSILGAAESSGAKLVFADNLYAYGPVDGPLREDLPAAARGPKGRIRAEMAADLLAAHREGRARVVIGRASDYYGPHGTGSTAGQTVFGRILAGKKPQWTGRLDQPHTVAGRPAMIFGRRSHGHPLAPDGTRVRPQSGAGQVAPDIDRGHADRPGLHATVHRNTESAARLVSHRGARLGSVGAPARAHPTENPTTASQTPRTSQA